jgi:hypothetical protein
VLRDGPEDPLREVQRAARPAVPAAFDPVQLHRMAARRGPGQQRHGRVVWLRGQVFGGRPRRDAVAGGPVGGDVFRRGHHFFAGQLPVPDGASLQHQPGQAATGQRAAVVGCRPVSGAHHHDHGRAELRHRREPAARLERGRGDQEQAGHRQQGVPGHVLGEPRPVRYPGEEDRPRPGRALVFEVAAEFRQETRVVQRGLAVRWPQRMPQALPSVGEHDRHAGPRPAPGEPGEPRHAPPVHPRTMQHDQQRRGGALPLPPRRAHQPVGTPHPRDLDRSPLELALRRVHDESVGPGRRRRRARARSGWPPARRSAREKVLE